MSPVREGSVAGKVYDRAYFDRWYRSRSRVVTPELTGRKVRLALAAAEWVLGRDARSVLDVGCGEGAWRAVLRRLRPGIRYVGVDSSDYVVRRFGRRRNLRLGSIDALDRLRIGGPFDLIVCADTLQYIPTPALRRGLRALHRRLRGVAFLEAFATEDHMAGDRAAWHHRSAEFYRREFRAAGFLPLGMHCHIRTDAAHRAGALERCG